MFAVDEAAAEAIRRAFNESGELAAVVRAAPAFPADPGQRTGACVCADDRRLEAPAAEAAPRAPNAAPRSLSRGRGAAPSRAAFGLSGFWAQADSFGDSDARPGQLSHCGASKAG